MVPKIQSTVELRERAIAERSRRRRAARIAADGPRTGAIASRIDASPRRSRQAHRTRPRKRALATPRQGWPRPTPGDRREDREGRGQDPRRARCRSREIEALAAELARDITGKVDRHRRRSKADAASGEGGMAMLSNMTTPAPRPGIRPRRGARRADRFWPRPDRLGRAGDDRRARDMFLLGQGPQGDRRRSTTISTRFANSLPRPRRCAKRPKR